MHSFKTLSYVYIKLAPLIYYATKTTVHQIIVDPCLNFDCTLIDWCNSMEDSPEHQLVECKEIQDDTHKQLVDSCMTSGHIGEILCNILAPYDSANQLQKSFIERVAFLMEQHDFVEELVP